MESTARSERTSRCLPPAATKVLKSLLEQWDGLTLFVDDPRIPLDNNASQRALRGLVVGHKIFYGAGALWARSLAMTLYSLFGT
jgi:transposase